MVLFISAFAYLYSGLVINLNETQFKMITINLVKTITTVTSNRTSIYNLQHYLLIIYTLMIT